MMKNNHIRLAVILGSISIIGIIVFQLYWAKNSFSLAEKQFNQTIEIALFNVAEKVLNFNGHEMPNENPVRQISSNYFIVDINDVIDANILDHYLKTEFDYRNVSIDYEYAIYDCETDKMVFGSYINQENRKDTDKQPFQKYDEFTYYFGIIFPSKTLFILKSINIWIISTLVLFTAVAFFAYAIYIILRQKRLSEVQKDFINNMTHEFKTPVSTIGISANVLSDPSILKDPERLKNYADIIKAQNIRLEQQIDKVLQLARIEANKVGFNIEMIDLNQLVAEVAQSFNLTMEEKGGIINLQLMPEPTYINTDKIHLTNVLYNLVDNAIKYCSKAPQVDISVKGEQDFVFLGISDNGIGIEKQYLKKVFQKFYRIPTGNVHNVKGFGIGLNYVLSFIRKMKWQIEIDSKPMDGSSFIIKIPKV
ncbi:MAG: HAMP domain-containing histidine kinase [Bacteroidales bacterium]|nr:HAMP domain-containing histidine kinase [Bacteroidales bacterium]MCF8405446.1 HAMP domain-containing histidine kinase [Bacteroidales bacterium]